jgi:hypothetical protein
MRMTLCRRSGIGWVRRKSVDNEIARPPAVDNFPPTAQTMINFRV